MSVALQNTVNVHTCRSALRKLYFFIRLCARITVYVMKRPPPPPHPPPPLTDAELFVDDDAVHAQQLLAQVRVAEREVADVTSRLGRRHQLQQR